MLGPQGDIADGYGVMPRFKSHKWEDYRYQTITKCRTNVSSVTGFRDTARRAMACSACNCSHPANRKLQRPAISPFSLSPIPPFVRSRVPSPPFRFITQNATPSCSTVTLPQLLPRPLPLPFHLLCYHNRPPSSSYRIYTHRRLYLHHPT